MTGPVVFAEHAQRATREFARNGHCSTAASQWRGMCAESRAAGTQDLDHWFAEGDGLLRDGTALRGFPPRSAAAFLRALDSVPPSDADPVDRALARRAVDGLELTWSRYWQRAAVGDRDHVVADTRSFSSVEMRLRSPDDTTLVTAVPWRASQPGASAELVGRAAAGLRRAAALPSAGLPAQPYAIVLDPGHAGAFFHELVGHPLEADIVAGRSSYLATRAGQRVAPSWFSVWDGAGPPAGGVQARVDDEGTAVRPAMLIDHGRVADALSDASAASLLGRSSNGHGRRLDYRHFVLPRMWHTVAAGPGGDPECSGRPRLRLRGLQLRWMNLITGEFEFAVSTALLTTAERTVRVGPFVLGGHGADVLAQLRSAGTTVRTCGARATKGCGKLNQFPLPVSFANSALWFPVEAVHVATS